MSLIEKSRQRKDRNLNFIKRISPLMEYFKEHGTIADIKQSDVICVDGEDVNIGWLVTNLRQEKRKGLLQESEIMLLDYIDMNWGNVLTQYLEVLDAYYDKYKTLSNLTQYSGIFKYKKQSFNLGQIVTHIRLSNKLTETEVELLQKRGLILKPKSVENVLYPFKVYYEMYGTISDISINQKFKIDDKIYNIGRTLNYFRTKYNKGELKEDYIKELEAIGVVWSPKKREESIVEI